MALVRAVCDGSLMQTDCAEALPFESRAAAGAMLARRLAGIHWRAPPIVLGLPRGGVPVAHAVAKALHLPHDALVVRKVGHPDQPEFAIGAVAPAGVTVNNRALEMGISRERFDALAAAKRSEVERLEKKFRPGHAPLSLAGRTAILVDDGLATGASMRAALAAARALGAAYLVVAVPVGSRHAVGQLAGLADEVICLYCPEPFQAVGYYYAKFPQLRDSDVLASLGDAA